MSADLGLENLLVVAAVAFAAPLLLGFVPALQVPAVVLEIAARTPGTLQAAIEAPTPELQTRTPRSAAPEVIASPSSRALSG